MTDGKGKTRQQSYRNTSQADLSALPSPISSILKNAGQRERQNYCDAMELHLFAMQQQLNELRRKCAAAEGRVTQLEAQCRALEWQVGYDRGYLAEIKSTRGWKLARALHFAYGLALLKRPVMVEAKNALSDALSRQENAGGRGRVRRILHAGVRFLLKQGSAAGKSILPTGIGKDGGSPGGEVYDSAYQDDECFEPLACDVKAIAFYLPQFHAIPENDEWWGEGFTEWSNTRKARPRFPNHYQPRTPHADIGYYNLSRVDALRRQAKLARAHNIDTFCLYHYWFDGRKLLETPVELLLANPDIDIGFCLCWANENWTRTWDGQEKSILIRQNYSPENDIRFIADLKRYLDDSRYLRVNGKPVVMIYHAKVLPDQQATFRRWRKWCRDNGVGEILIWSCRAFVRDNEFNRNPEIDREVEFPPHQVATLETFPAERFRAYENCGHFYNYARVVEDALAHKTMADAAPYPIYRTVTLGWDNSCRREHGWSVWQYFSLERYHAWLRDNLEHVRSEFLESERFVFINAWNEWAEGTYLEPDERYGYASLNTTTRALRNLPCFPVYETLAPAIGEIASPGKILVHFHCFYPELALEMCVALDHIPFNFDCVVTTDTRAKRDAIRQAWRRKTPEHAQNFEVKVLPNRGRDIAPFFAACAASAGEYDFIGHFHTKRSNTVNWGDEWRHYLWDQLLGSRQGVADIFGRFARDARLGLYFPPVFPAMRTYRNWEKNRARCARLLAEMQLPDDLPEFPEFPAGQMFWARTRAIAPLFAQKRFDSKEFEKEADQIFDTLAHALERIWKYVVRGTGYETLSAVTPPSAFASAKAAAGSPHGGKKRLALFVHYHPDGAIAATDVQLLRSLAPEAEIVFIANGKLRPGEAYKVQGCCRRVVERENRGFDFAAWRDVLVDPATDPARYDEVILLNNSIIGPFRPFSGIFAEMEARGADFWGLSEFPRTCNPRREEAKAFTDGVIPRHLQSYFLVFSRAVVASEAFRAFWRGVADEDDIIKVVSKYEVRLSGVLEAAGFRSAVLLAVSGRLQELEAENPSFNALYCRPLDFLLLGFPFIKKNICYYLPDSQLNEVVHTLARWTQYPVGLIELKARRR